MPLATEMPAPVRAATHLAVRKVAKAAARMLLRLARDDGLHGQGVVAFCAFCLEAFPGNVKRAAMVKGEGADPGKTKRGMDLAVHPPAVRMHASMIV